MHRETVVWEARLNRTRGRNADPITLQEMNLLFMGLRSYLVE